MSQLTREQIAAIAAKGGASDGGTSGGGGTHSLDAIARALGTTKGKLLAVGLRSMPPKKKKPQPE